LDTDGDLHRVDGSAVFLTSGRDTAPLGLRSMVEGTRTLHREVVLLSWEVEDKPKASPHELAAQVDALGRPEDGLHRIHVRLGYRERLDAVGVLRRVVDETDALPDDLDPDAAYWFLSDPIPVLRRGGVMPLWRQRVFLLLDRLSTDRVAQLKLPRERAVVVGHELPL
jgi:KUP system potassium uptake protein